MDNSIGASRTGPRPKADKGTQTGYRITARQRLELKVAEAFTGAQSMQAVLDEAVNAFLESLRRDADGFTEAIERAEQHQRSRSGIRNLGQSGST